MTTFKWLVRLRIFANLILAGFMLWAPAAFLELLGFTEPGVAPGDAQERWAQALGIAYLFLTFVYIPPAINPARTMMSNAVVVLAPVLPIALFFWLAWKMNFAGGFLCIALYELAFALLLNTVFKRAWIADLMSKP